MIQDCLVVEEDDDDDEQSTKIDIVIIAPIHFGIIYLRFFNSIKISLVFFIICDALASGSTTRSHAVVVTPFYIY
jgi:hypothetical protein